MFAMIRVLPAGVAAMLGAGVGPANAYLVGGRKYPCRRSPRRRSRSRSSPARSAGAVAGGPRLHPCALFSDAHHWGGGARRYRRSAQPAARLPELHPARDAVVYRSDDRAVSRRRRLARPAAAAARRGGRDGADRRQLARRFGLERARCAVVLAARRASPVAAHSPRDRFRGTLVRAQEPRRSRRQRAQLAARRDDPRGLRQRRGGRLLRRRLEDGELFRPLGASLTYVLRR